MNYNYPVYRPSLSGNEKKYVNECLDSTWISSKGKFIPIFERQFAEYLGVQHAASVCNGTVALHAALLALGVGPGDEVIVPTLTYIASANAITYTGASPVFVDSLSDTWQVDPEDVQRKITPKTKAIMVVHLYGQPCEMDKLCSIAKKHGVYLIEDCAEALGSEYHGKKVGVFGDVSTFSFFGNKTLTTGEGGMVVTNDETLHDRVVHFKGQGLAKQREYWHDVIGYNYRMTNICAAIGLAQLERIVETIAIKRKIAMQYRELLKDLPVVCHGEQKDTFNTFWMNSILTPKAEQRDPLREELKQAGIETRPIFYPVHTMPMYSQKYQKHAVAEDLGWRGMNLPSYPGLEDQDVHEICVAIRKYFER